MKEPSKYFIDSTGILCVAAAYTPNKTKMVFQVVGVFGYPIPDKQDYNLGFMIAKYKKEKL